MTPRNAWAVLSMAAMGALLALAWAYVAYRAPAMPYAGCVGAACGAVTRDIAFHDLSPLLMAVLWLLAIYANSQIGKRYGKDKAMRLPGSFMPGCSKCGTPHSIVFLAKPITATKPSDFICRNDACGYQWHADWQHASIDHQGVIRVDITDIVPHEPREGEAPPLF